MSRNVLCVIPARGGSKGVPRKNILPLGGKPLLSYAVAAAKNCPLIGKVIVSTEDDEIADIAVKAGAEVPFKRPAEFATDSAQLWDMLRHAAREMDKLGFVSEAVISLQPTCPFIRPETLEKVVRLWSDSNCDSVSSVAQYHSGHPYISKRLKEGGAIEPFVPIPVHVDLRRRQLRETAYFLTGGFYLKSRRLLDSEQDPTDSHFLGKDQRAVVVDEIEAVDINCDFDVLLARFIVEKGLERSFAGGPVAK